jgi:hypothetical protein
VPYPCELSSIAAPLLSALTKSDELQHCPSSTRDAVTFELAAKPAATLDASVRFQMRESALLFFKSTGPFNAR